MANNEEQEIAVRPIKVWCIMFNTRIEPQVTSIEYRSASLKFQDREPKKSKDTSAFFLLVADKHDTS